MIMKDIAIFGAGGFGREVLSIIKEINNKSCKWNFLGFFDDGRNVGDECDGYPILGGISVLNTWNSQIDVVVAIGDPRIKKEIVSNIFNPLVNFPTIIHPTVCIGDESTVAVGDGCIICAGCHITVNVKIGKFVVLNLANTVGHDVVINDFSAFMPSCNISGEVYIGEGVYCGTGVKLINQVEVGSYSILGAGAVIIKNIPSNCTAVGVPAKPIKFSIDFP